jgi:hypothetical protein
MKPRKAAVIFIFITVTLDMLALGLIPIIPIRIPRTLHEDGQA